MIDAIHRLYQEVMSQPGFSPAMLLVGLIMYGGWTGAYLCVIISCAREKSYGVPMASLCFNVVWEVCFTFMLLNQQLFWFFKVGNGLWLLFDIIIFIQFLRYGREAQVIPFLKKNFYAVTTFTMILFTAGLPTFTYYFRDYTGSVSSMAMNFSMSILYIFMLFARPDLKGLNYPAAWLKMIGTAGGSVFLYFWLPAQFVKHTQMVNGVPIVEGMLTITNVKFVDGAKVVETVIRTDPVVYEPTGYGFLYFLYVGIFVIDCIYIYLLAKRRRELREASTGKARPATA